ncbi:putative bifunctional diguanylate cyclase/phosphodiesterase [Salinimonas sediminis]|nr:GGDEF domain-containing response regulator [Salinimonas sediminis]
MATRVLLVDDDDIDRRAIKRALNCSHSPHQIIEVSNANDAFVQAEHHAFDVILMDYQLPGTTGVEAITILRDNPTLSRAAIIMLSNRASDEVVVNCINAGAHDFLLKEDVTPAQLKRSILQSQKRSELERKLVASYQKVRVLAEQDTLTGLHNRYFFEQALDALLLSAKRTPEAMVAVMLLDLDKFKHINDTFGHPIGDKLLIAVTGRMKRTLRENEMLARLGGDEFGFASGHLYSLQEVHTVARRMLAVFATEFDIDGHKIFCRGSVGIALSPQNGQSVKELMKFADIAMYRAKHEVGSRICIFEDNMQQAFLRKFKIEQKLRDATTMMNFGVVFQPIVSQGIMVGMETLIRWPTGHTTTAPEEFIPVAEEAGLIQQIGHWVFETALHSFDAIKPHLPADFYITVNVSPRQLAFAGFAQFVEQTLAKYQVRPEYVVIEITETALLKQDDRVTTQLNALSAMGVRIALDDFGTGYSSLSYLLHCPVDIVKVDKTIIQRITDADSRHKHVLEGLALMLARQHIAIVAEGVESKSQLALCNTLGILTHQGFFYHRPMPLAALKQILGAEESPL